MTDPSTGSGQDRRFIEDSFPVKEVGVAAAKEKNIRHGHISTLHIWWARRPLAARRAATSETTLVGAQEGRSEGADWTRAFVEAGRASETSGGTQTHQL